MVGKSTLANVLAGRDKFEVDQGQMIFNGEVINEMLPENRAGQGIFYPFNILLLFQV